MRKTAARIALLLGLLVIIGFTVVLVNQTAQLVILAGNVSPFFGSAVFWTLIALYVFCLAVPAYLLLRLPKPLKPPASENDPAFPEHLERLIVRLSSRRKLRSPPFQSPVNTIVWRSSTRSVPSSWSCARTVRSRQWSSRTV